MKSKRHSNGVLRRSVALPRILVEEALRRAPAGEGANVNRIVRVALEEFIQKRRDEQFQAEMEQMARDPMIRRESRKIEREFRAAEGDGLPHA